MYIYLKDAPVADLVHEKRVLAGVPGSRDTARHPNTISHASLPMPPDCVFRPMTPGDSERIRPRIPSEGALGFRLKTSTYSDVRRPAIPSEDALGFRGIPARRGGVLGSVSDAG